MSSIEVDRILGKDDDSAFHELLSIPEDQWFDRKSGRISPKDLARPLIAFANSEGGTIAVGLSNGKIDGVSPQLDNAIRQAAIDFTVPPVRARITSHEADGKRILVVRVEPSNHVHTSKSGECYLRIGDESRKLSLAEQQELTFDRGPHLFESSPAGLVIKDLGNHHLTAFKELIGSASNLKALQARDLVNRQDEVTVAAELLFDDRPQRDYSNAHVRIIKYDSDERGVGARMSLVEDARVDGPIPQQISEATRIIERLLPHRQQLAASGRFENTPIIPRDAWLEGLVNAVVHRSYSLMGDHIRVEIFPTRIEISSPGRFPGLIDPSRPLNISRFARNPRIARVCSDMGITRELGEGINRIFEEMKIRGLTEPIYKQGSANVVLILKSSDSVSSETLNQLSKSAQKVLNVLRLEDRPLGTGQIAELAKIARPTAIRSLQQLKEAGLVVWTGTSAQDPRASWKVL